jgi:hypothetical protein
MDSEWFSLHVSWESSLTGDFRRYEWHWKWSVSSGGALQQELRVDLKSLNPFLRWELTPKYNLEWS